MRPERRFWLRAAGASALALQMAWLRGVLAAGSVEKGIYSLRGDVRVNGIPAIEGMEIKAGDVIITGANGQAMFVAGRDAFLVRANSRVEAEGGARGEVFLTGLRIVTGAVLSVFAPGNPKTLRTPTATIGIRGTALYVEASAARTYVCTCYGEVEIASAADPSVRETVRTQHHEQPRYVMAAGASQMMMSAPVLNHSDAELMMLEGLVGRRPPFANEPGYREYRY